MMLMVLLHKETNASIRARNHISISKPATNFPAVTVDTRLNFNPHFQNTWNNGSNIGITLTRIMLNVRTPTCTRTLLITRIIVKTIVHAAVQLDQDLEAS